MKLNENLKAYYNDPFTFLDNVKLEFRGRLFNPFVKYQLNRRLAFWIAIFSAACWVLFGFDSSIGQPLMLLYRMPEFLTGTINFQTWINETWVSYYGKDMHYSAFVIYGLAYWALSRHYEKMGIVKSKNVAYSLAITLFSIALFEGFWITSYAIFQNQSWVLKPQFPQLRIILQNVVFTLLGVFGILYMYADSFVFKNGKRIKDIFNNYKRLYHFQWNKYSILLIAASIVWAINWVNYPFHVERFSVTLETGETWENSNLFPQTLYTIDMNPDDTINAGEWHFKENNLIHGINTLVKVLWTLTVCYVGMVKKNA